MKGLVLTDIHEDEETARIYVDSEKPDFVLDCGDHERIRNLFGTIPHFYIQGNHEPDKIIYEVIEGRPLPNLIYPGQVITLKVGSDQFSFSGIGGNYSARGGKGNVEKFAIDMLSNIPSTGLDVLLVHESPLDVESTIAERSGALNVLNEIKRIEPICMFAGHVGTYQKQKTDSGIIVYRLPDVLKGYGLLFISNDEISFSFKESHHFGNKPKKN